MLRQNKRYRETHNAVCDALDELEIIRLLGHELEEYEIALISDKKTFAAESQKMEETVMREATDFSNKKRGILSRLFSRKQH